MGRRSKRSYRLAALKGWRTRRANVKAKASSSSKQVPNRKRSKKRTRKPSRKKMWRVTVGAPYEIRQRGKKKNRTGSPDKASYMVRGWYSSYEDAISAQKKLEKLAIEGRNSYEDETPRAFHRDANEEVNIAIETVEYDSSLLDIVEETNER